MWPASVGRAFVAWSVVSVLVVSGQRGAIGAESSVIFGARNDRGGPRTPGAELWVARYDGPGNGYDDASDIQASPDGSMVFVTGSSTVSPGDTDYDTVAYDASSGAVLWEARYDGPGHGSDGAASLGISPDGTKVFVTGGSVGPDGHADYATVAYVAATGSVIWVSRYDGPAAGGDWGRFLAVSPDGTKIFVTGDSESSVPCPYDPHCLEWATVAYDAMTGASMWSRRYVRPIEGRNFTASLGVSPDGSKVFVTGKVAGRYQSSMFSTVAYSASTGKELWVADYRKAGRDIPTSLGVSPDGHTNAG